MPARFTWGTNRDDRLYGVAGPDQISGMSGNDTLYGAAGDDWLYGGVGNDTIYGGSGRDRAIFVYPRSHYSIDFSGTATFITYIGPAYPAGPDGNDRLFGVEEIGFLMGGEVLRLSSVLASILASARPVSRDAATRMATALEHGLGGAPLTAPAGGLGRLSGPGGTGVAAVLAAGG